MDPVRPRLSAVVFPGGFNLPLWTAIDRGYLAQRGIDVEITYTTSSVEQLSGLIEGRWDIGLTGFDNIVAYQEGQGETKVATEPDLFAFMGGDNAFLRLVVQAEIDTYADLRGRTLSVDALTTGFAFVLRKMLSLNGIAETDINFERAGGALQRFDALKDRRHAGTLLLTPFELIGAKFGLRVLQSASDVLPHYQGICGAARRAWASRNKAVLTGFIAAYVDALSWLFDPSHRAAASEILAAHVPNLQGAMVGETLDVLLAPRLGFEPRARLDPEGVRTVLSLRSEYGRPQKLLQNPEKYCDESFYVAALGRA
jgi:ABC-type nitrate/sulfonate/bicarbonate transport system substrate-binding protein